LDAPEQAGKEQLFAISSREQQTTNFAGEGNLRSMIIQV